LGIAGDGLPGGLWLERVQEMSRTGRLRRSQPLVLEAVEGRVERWNRVCVPAKAPRAEFFKVKLAAV